MKSAEKVSEDIKEVPVMEKAFDLGWLVIITQKSRVSKLRISAAMDMDSFQAFERAWSTPLPHPLRRPRTKIPRKVPGPLLPPGDRRGCQRLRNPYLQDLPSTSAMANKDEVVKVGVLVEDAPVETPRFRDAIFGIRSVADIKAILTHDEYDPHVHIMVLLFFTFMVGVVSFALGA
jgi:hypothetical protein